MSQRVYTEGVMARRNKTSEGRIENANAYIELHQSQIDIGPFIVGLLFSGAFIMFLVFILT